MINYNTEESKYKLFMYIIYVLIYIIYVYYVYLSMYIFGFVSNFINIIMVVKTNNANETSK